MPSKAKRGPTAGETVDEGLLRKAARAYIDLEDAGKLSASEIGRRIGLKRAPEWLKSDRFKQILELERFDAELGRVQGIQGAAPILDQILQLGFSEMYRRLKMEPEDIPPPQLFGDLTRLLKMKAELEVQAKGGTPAPQSLMITIRQEILNIPDRRLQEAVLQKIFKDYQAAFLTVKDLLPGGASPDHTDVIDAVGTPVGVSGGDGTLALPAAPMGGVHPRVWTDPVEQG